MKPPPSSPAAGQDAGLGWRFRITENAPCFCHYLENFNARDTGTNPPPATWKERPTSTATCARINPYCSGQPEAWLERISIKLESSRPKKLLRRWFCNQKDASHGMSAFPRRGGKPASSRGREQAHTRMGCTLFACWCQQNFWKTLGGAANASSFRGTVTVGFFLKGR